MCSNCECDQVVAAVGETLKLSETSGPVVKPCRRCGGEPFIILDKVHVECQQCFLESCKRKFRSTLGKSKLVRDKGSILVAYSGGPSSVALLDLLKNSMKIENGREQKFRPSLLYIDTKSVLAGDLLENKPKRVADLIAMLHGLSQDFPDWPIYWTTIETAMVDDRTNQLLYERFFASSDLQTIESSPLFKHTLTNDIIKQQTNALELTDRQKLIEDNCSKLISLVATNINGSIEESEDRLKYVFVASTATQLANNLLVDVIFGCGSTIGSAVNFCDTRQPVPILRPMREFSKKEIAFYLRARNIEAYTVPNLLTGADRKASIQTVTEAFLSKLYVDYPSTYSTLLRTGNKMQN